MVSTYNTFFGHKKNVNLTKYALKNETNIMERLNILE